MYKAEGDTVTEKKPDVIEGRTVYVPPVPGERLDRERETLYSSPVAIFSPVLGVSAEYQTFMGRHSLDSRGVVTGEVMPLGVPPSGNYARSDRGAALYQGTQWGLGLGYSFLEADRYLGHGPSARLIFPLPDIDTQLSLGAGVRNYVGEGVNVWRPNIGITAEHGFGLLFVRLGLGWDSAVVRRRQVEDGLSFSASLTITSPWSRIRRLFNGQEHSD